jgi:hypothetical protein
MNDSGLYRCLVGMAFRYASMRRQILLIEEFIHLAFHQALIPEARAVRHVGGERLPGAMSQGSVSVRCRPFREVPL